MLLASVFERVNARGDLVPHAHLAALAIEHGLVLASTDGGFRPLPACAGRTRSPERGQPGCKAERRLGQLQGDDCCRRGRERDGPPEAVWERLVAFAGTTRPPAPSRRARTPSDPPDRLVRLPRQLCSERCGKRRASRPRRSCACTRSRGLGPAAAARPRGVVRLRGNVRRSPLQQLRGPSGSASASSCRTCRGPRSLRRARRRRLAATRRPPPAATAARRRHCGGRVKPTARSCESRSAARHDRRRCGRDQRALGLSGE
jgi:hypothetical protein